MEGNREEIAAGFLLNFVPGEVVRLIKSQGVFGIINLLHQIFVHPRFDIENKIVGHGIPGREPVSLWTRDPINVKPAKIRKNQGHPLVHLFFKKQANGGRP
jgi:hypothetical protein